MRWSYTIGRIAGTAIKVHVTFLLIVGWWALIGLFGRAGQRAALTSALDAARPLRLHPPARVRAHPDGPTLRGAHSLTSSSFPIGGEARLERIPDEPRQELLIALAGPAVTLGIAESFWRFCG